MQAPTGRRERQKLERRERIFDAAIALFRERGFDSVTVVQITDRADVAKGTFFNYYESKSDVLLEFGRRLSLGMLDYAKGLKGDDPRELVRRFFARMARQARAEREVFDIVIQKVASEPLFQAAHARGRSALVDLLREFLERGVASGIVEASVDLELAAELIRDVWVSTVRSWVASGHGFSLGRRVEAKHDLVFRGLSS